VVGSTLATDDLEKRQDIADATMLASLLDKVYEIAFCCDQSGRVVYGNSHYRAWSGRVGEGRVSEACGQAREVLGGRAAAKLRLQGGLSGEVSRVDGGGMVCVLCEGVDPAVHAELVASEARYRALVGTVSHGVWRIDPKGNFIEPSVEVCRLLGIDPARVSEFDWRDSIHPEDVHHVEKAWLRSLATGEPHDNQQRLKLKDGTYRWHHVRAVAVRDAAGNIVEWVGSHQDIHARWMAEEELRRSESRYRALAEATNVAVWVAGPDGALTCPQVEFARMTGLSPEQTMGWGWLEAIHPDDRERTRRASAALRDGTADANWAYHIEHRVRQADGEYRWMSCRAAAVRDGAGQLVEIVGATRDIHDRKQVDEQVRRSLTIMELIVRSSQAFVCVVGANGEINEPAEGFWRTTGLSFEQYRGMGWKVAYLPEELEHIERIWAEATAKREPCEWEHQLRMADGKYRWFLERMVPLLSEDQELEGWGAVHMDIHDSKMAQRAIAVNEERFRSLAEAVPQAMWTQRVGGDRVEYANRQWQRWTGFTVEEFNRLGVGEWCHPDERQSVCAQWTNPVGWAGEFSLEFRHLRKNASGEREYRRARLEIRPIHDGPGLAARYVGTLADVEEQRLMEQMLRDLAEGADQQRRWLEMVLEALPVPAVLFDSQTGSLLFSTREARRMFMHVAGSEDVAEVRRRVGLFNSEGVAIPGEDWPARRVMRGEKLVGVEMTVVGERGRVSVLVDGELLPAAHGQPRVAVVCMRDVTRLKQIEAELRAAVELKDRFMAVLSHELRTPLTPVLTSAQLLEADPSVPAQAREAISVMRRNVELEIRLIDDLLDLTRISRGKLRMDLRPVELMSVLSNVLEICRPDIRTKALKVKLDAPERPLIVSADAARLHQVFWNLLKNSVKFTSEGGNISVHVAEEKGMAVVRVVDDGIGISPHLLPRVFGAFMQGDHDARRYGGLGLGLAIAKALVEQHGGELEARSSGVGRGTEFVAVLPIGTPAQPAGEDTGGPGKSAATSLRILLVEDHVDTARVMQRLLKRFGHEPTVVGTVAAALAALRSQAFDLLISDIGLPDGSGYDLMRQSTGHRPPAIALSGFGMDDDLTRSKQAGFAVHLTKPVDARLLELTILRVVGRETVAGGGSTAVV